MSRFITSDSGRERRAVGKKKYVVKLCENGIQHNAVNILTNDDVDGAHWDG